MLEKLLKTAVIPAAVLASSLSPAYSSYLSFVNFNDREYAVEVDDSKKLIQVNADKDIAKELGFAVLVGRKSEEIELDVQSMTYEAANLVLGKVGSAKETANKINFFTKLMGAKIPYPVFFIESPRDLQMKFIAVKKAWAYRNAALKFLESKPDNLGRYYENLCLMQDSILKMSDYLKELEKVQKKQTDWLRTEDINFVIKEMWQTYNAGKLEETVIRLSEKYKLRNKEIEELESDLEKSLEESREYQNFRNSLEKREIGKILQKYKFVLEPSEIIFRQNYSVPLWTSKNPEMQVGEKERANLEIRVEKSMRKKGSCNFRVYALTDKAFSKFNSSFFMIYPESEKIEEISQKAYAIRQNSAKWQETFRYGKDKVIVMELDAIDYAVDSTISMFFKGFITKAKNLFKYSGKKTLNIMLEDDKRILGCMTRDISQSYDKKYLGKESKINPTRLGKDIAGYLWIVPASNENCPYFILANLGLMSKAQSNEEAAARKTLLIPINDSLEYHFDSKLCKDYFENASQKMLSIESNKDLEFLTWREIEKDALRLDEAERLNLNSDILTLEMWKKENPVQYIDFAYYFESLYLDDTRDYIKYYEILGQGEGYSPLLKTKKFFFIPESNVQQKIIDYFKEEISLKFGKEEVEVKSRTYPQFEKKISRH